MKKLLLLLPLIFMVGCTASISDETIESSVTVCEVNGGISRIFGKSGLHNDSNDYVVCKNGAQFNNPVELVKKLGKRK